MIREAKLSDAGVIAEIYNYYVLNTTVTFEEEAITAEIMESRMTDILRKFPFLVYVKDDKIIAFAYATPWRIRAAYKNSVEITIYLQKGFTTKGIGSELYSELLTRLKRLKLHAIIGGIALPNDACIALHQKFGFEKVAHFKEIGFKFNTWVDVGYWQKIF